MMKDRRMMEIAESRNGSASQPATPKQIGYLKSLKVKIEPGLTKARASELIDEAVRKMRQEGIEPSTYGLRVRLYTSHTCLIMSFYLLLLIVI